MNDTKIDWEEVKEKITETAQQMNRLVGWFKSHCQKSIDKRLKAREYNPKLGTNDSQELFIAKHIRYQYIPNNRKKPRSAKYK